MSGWTDGTADWQYVRLWSWRTLCCGFVGTQSICADLRIATGIRAPSARLLPSWLRISRTNRCRANIYAPIACCVRPDLHVAWRGNDAPNEPAKLAALATGHLSASLYFAVVGRFDRMTVPRVLSCPPAGLAIMQRHTLDLFRLAQASHRAPGAVNFSRLSVSRCNPPALNFI